MDFHPGMSWFAVKILLEIEPKIWINMTVACPYGGRLDDWLRLDI